MENKLNEIGNNNLMVNYKKTDDIFADMQELIETTQKAAHSAVNTLLVQRNWLIGYRIAEEELGDNDRTENYGLNIMKKLSERLTNAYGKGFTKTNLYSFYSFYKMFPNIFHTACGKSSHLLSWSHYRTLVQVHDPVAREWYATSFCTFKRVFPQVEKLISEGARVIPIMSEVSFGTDTRFGKAADNIEFLEKTTGETVIGRIQDAEPIGPKKLLDVMVVAPCTGNTMAKIAAGIADSAVTLAVKSHLRNKRPVVIAVSSNDGLGNNAKNLGMLANMKNIYLVPFGQDDCMEKQNSLVADMNRITDTVKLALDGEQIQPVIISY